MTEQGAVPTAAGSTARRRPPPLLAAAAIGVGSRSSSCRSSTRYRARAPAAWRPGATSSAGSARSSSSARPFFWSSSLPRPRSRSVFRSPGSSSGAISPAAGVGRRGGAPARHPELRRGLGPSRRLRAARPPPGGARAARRRPGARDLRPSGCGLGRSHARHLPVRLPAHGLPFRDLDPGLEDAGRGLGQSRFVVFRRVTLPLLRPSIGAGASSSLSTPCRISVQCRSCDTTYRRGPSSSSTACSSTDARRGAGARARTRPPSSSSSSCGREAGSALHRSSPGAARASAPVALGRWRWPALGLCVHGSFGWLSRRRARLLARARHFSRVPLASSWEPALSSVLVSLGAAAIAVAAAIPVAVLAVRYASGWTRGLERLAYAGNALPDRDRALPRLLRGELRQPALPDARSPAPRLRDPVLRAGSRGSAPRLSSASIRTSRTRRADSAGGRFGSSRP